MTAPSANAPHDRATEDRTGEAERLARIRRRRYAAEARDERGDVHMNPFGRSTRGLIADACSRGAWVVPLFVDYDVDTSLVELAEPVQPTDDAAVHHVGELIAAMGNMARGVARAEHPDIERFTRRIFYEAR